MPMPRNSALVNVNTLSRTSTSGGMRSSIPSSVVARKLKSMFRRIVATNAIAMNMAMIWKFDFFI